MSSSKELRSRIRSVANTSQITRAMGLVAAVRLRKAQARLQSAEEYWKRLDSMLATLVSDSDQSHPLMERREQRKRTLLVFGSDRGLCGSFNRDVASALSEALETGGIETDIVPVGDRMASLLKASGLAPTLVDSRFTTRDFLSGDSLAAEMFADWFMSGLTDRVDVLAATPSGGAFRRLASRTVLPLEGDIGIFLTRDWIVEPSRAAILGQLAQECYRSSLVLAAVGSETAEQMARLTAMTAATRNADDMLADLKLASNKIRQAAITSELTEIVAGTA